MATMTTTTTNTINLTTTMRQAKDVWWKEASVYQIYPSSFLDSNGDGIGDIQGVIQKLDYLELLGVDIVWLCPVYKSPQKDMGYDIADYRDIHPPYGTLSDVEELILGLHTRGMKFVMDLVVNHTSDQHEWFQESRSSLDNSKRDWYIWRKPAYDASGNRHPPNNWASIFGGPAWTFDTNTNEYYLHLFCPEQPDLNWENPDVVKEVHDIMEFWLRKGVDGFRMDVINLISKTPGLPDAPIVHEKQPFQPAQMHYAFGPRLHEHLRNIRQILDRYNAFAVGEMPWVKEENNVLDVVASHRKELNMIFQFDIVDMDIGDDGKFSSKDWNLPTLKSIVQKWQTKMYEVGGWNALFMENHDQSRSVSRFTRHRPEHRGLAASMLATFLTFQSGTPFIYQGQELGMGTLPKTWPIEEYKDVETQNFYRDFMKENRHDQKAINLFWEGLHLRARDHGRSPIQWNTAKNAGFSSGSPWMRVNDDYLELNAEHQVQDPNSAFSNWRAVLALRKRYKDIFVYGRFDLLDLEHESVFCYQRSSSTGTGYVIANFKDTDIYWDMPKSLAIATVTAAQISSNYTNEVAIQDGSMLLRPFEAVVFVNEQPKSVL